MGGGALPPHFCSIPTLALYGPVKESGYISGPGPDTGALFGGILELIVGLACIGTAVALYPVVKRQNEGIAMGFVGARVLEAATIFSGWPACGRSSPCGRTELEQSSADGGCPCGVLRTSVPRRTELHSSRERSTARDPVVPVALGTEGSSRPGFIGGAALISYHTATLFGFTGETATVLAGIAVLPIATWEFGLGVYLMVKGFRPSAVANSTQYRRCLAHPGPVDLHLIES